MFLDDEVYHLYIRYIGKEVVRHATVIPCDQFKPLLIRDYVLKAVKK